MINEYAKSKFEIEKQFKKDFGMTLDEANRKTQEKKKQSDELYYLRCLLNGLDIHTCSPVTLSDEQTQQIEQRINKLES